MQYTFEFNDNVYNVSRLTGIDVSDLQRKTTGKIFHAGDTIEVSDEQAKKLNVYQDYIAQNLAVSSPDLFLQSRYGQELAQKAGLTERDQVAGYFQNNPLVNVVEKVQDKKDESGSTELAIGTALKAAGTVTRWIPGVVGKIGKVASGIGSSLIAHSAVDQLAEKAGAGKGTREFLSNVAAFAAPEAKLLRAPSLARTVLNPLATGAIYGTAQFGIDRALDAMEVENPVARAAVSLGAFTAPHLFKGKGVTGLKAQAAVTPESFSTKMGKILDQPGLIKTKPLTETERELGQFADFGQLNGYRNQSTKIMNKLRQLEAESLGLKPRYSAPVDKAAANAYKDLCDAMESITGIKGTSIKYDNLAEFNPAVFQVDGKSLFTKSGNSWKLNKNVLKQAYRTNGYVDPNHINSQQFSITIGKDELNIINKGRFNAIEFDALNKMKLTPAQKSAINKQLANLKFADGEQVMKFNSAGKLVCNRTTPAELENFLAANVKGIDKTNLAYLTDQYGNVVRQQVSNGIVFRPSNTVKLAESATGKDTMIKVALLKKLNRDHPRVTSADEWERIITEEANRATSPTNKRIYQELFKEYKLNQQQVSVDNVADGIFVFDDVAGKSLALSFNSAKAGNNLISVISAHSRGVSNGRFTPFGEVGTYNLFDNKTYQTLGI